MSVQQLAIGEFMLMLLHGVYLLGAERGVERMSRPAAILKDALSERRVLTIPPQIKIDNPGSLGRPCRRHAGKGSGHAARSLVRMGRDEHQDTPAFRRSRL